MYPAVSSIRNSFRNLSPDESWSFRGAGRAEIHAFSHNYHRYPAKFIPQLVRRLISKYAPDKGGRILDPFGGCGTTLVEAKLMGHESIGFDINPVAKLITQTKTTAILPKALAGYREEFLRNYKFAARKKYVHHERINYWFDGRNVRQLDRIYSAINDFSDIRIRRFFLCAFSHTY